MLFLIGVLLLFVLLYLFQDRIEERLVRCRNCKRHFTIRKREEQQTRSNPLTPPDAPIATPDAQTEELLDSHLVSSSPTLTDTVMVYHCQHCGEEWIAPYSLPDMP